MKQFYHIRHDPDLGESLCAMRHTPCDCTGFVEKSPIPGYLTGINPYKHIMISNQKNVSTLTSYVDIIIGILPN